MDNLINLRPVLTEPGAQLHIVDSLPIDKLTLGEQTIPARETPTYDIVFSDVGDGVLAMGDVVFKGTASCSRCLVDFPIDLEVDVDILFYKDPAFDNDGDPLPGMDDEGNVDLESELVTLLLVEVPFAPLHDKDCQGLCTKCGCDLNTESCDCDEHIDPGHPFAGLADLIVGD